MEDEQTRAGTRVNDGAMETAVRIGIVLRIWLRSGSSILILRGNRREAVISGGPRLGRGTVADRLRRFAAKHDSFRSAIINEPRGSDVLVGALLLEAIRSRLHDGRDLLQQCRLSGYVRPRDDRSGGYAGPSGPHPAGRTSYRDSDRGGARHPAWRRQGSRWRMLSVSAIARAWCWMCRGSVRSPAILPGVGTGSFSQSERRSN